MNYPIVSEAMHHVAELRMAADACQPHQAVLAARLRTAAACMQALASEVRMQRDGRKVPPLIEDVGRMFDEYEADLLRNLT